MSSLVWFRRDLRLADNPAWAAATSDHDAVEALFVLDRSLLATAGSLRRNLLFAHLAALDAELQHLGGGLTVETGNPETIIPTAAARHDAVYWNRSYTPFAGRRDAAVAAAVGPSIETFDGDVLHAPEEVMTGGGTPYRVFTPYHRKWSQTEVEPWPQAGDAEVLGSSAADLATVDSPIMTGGEAGARERLERFLEIVDDYETDRNRPDLDRTSHLSADLKFGT
ncbi:MAG: deoxyribodipyrimidine photo-lyase, partial [Acidimicrobiia bacterium]|nr:deoxyribodipyrimidine photo-lyase [Acidimicrobiia bacterium]